MCPACICVKLYFLSKVGWLSVDNDVRSLMLWLIFRLVMGWECEVSCMSQSSFRVEFDGWGIEATN